MEIWDAYYADGTPAGVDLIRGEQIPEGLYHMVCEILVRHTDGDFLLMKRDERKSRFGGYFEASAGGSALKGEDALTCAKRELFEETGISSGELTDIGRYISKNTVYFNFLCTTDCAKDTVTLQEGETVGFEWVSEEGFIEFINSGRMIPSQKERYTEYFRRIGYISDAQYKYQDKSEGGKRSENN